MGIWEQAKAEEFTFSELSKVIWILYLIVSTVINDLMVNLLFQDIGVHINASLPTQQTAVVNRVNKAGMMVNNVNNMIKCFRCGNKHYVQGCSVLSCRHCAGQYLQTLHRSLWYNGVQSPPGQACVYKMQPQGSEDQGAMQHSQENYCKSPRTSKWEWHVHLWSNILWDSNLLLRLVIQKLLLIQGHFSFLELQFLTNVFNNI